MSGTMSGTGVPTTLLELLHAAPDASTAMLDPESGVRLSYASLRGQVLRMAEALAGAGIRRGDRVAIALPNGLPAVVSFLAAGIAGTAAPLNPAYRREEFSFFLDDTAARLLVIPPQGADEARSAAEGRIPVLAVSLTDGEARLATTAASAGFDPPAPEDVALVLHTSGSTGRPKRVPIGHGNLGVSAWNTVNTYGLCPDDISLCVMPLFHVHGLVASTLATLLSGGALVLPSRFQPLAFWRTLRDSRVTWYSAVPTIHQLAMARAASGRPPGLESLRFIRSCSAPLAAELARKMEEIAGVPVLEAYGMTEASHQMASNPLPPRARKFGTVGTGTGVRISIMDAAGNHLDAGGQGEVVIQGPNVVRGYENNPEANSRSFVDGWFRTGDQGILDQDGYLRLTGRLKELINRGGEKISPVEIDEALLTHPAVAEAVAFGVPHPGWGEEVAAAVVLREPVPESEILSHCRNRLAEFKCPKKIHIVDAIPRTATGKIQRRNVAATFQGS